VKTDSVVLRFSTLTISRWNRSFGSAPDVAYVKELAADIKRNGLLHPLTLVKASEGEGYCIVAGAHRFAALKQLRGEDSSIEQSEFRIIADMDDASEKCLAVSLAENHHRRASSTYEMATYVKRLIGELGVDQGRVAKQLRLDRQKVNRLTKLADCFGSLPERWQKDLSCSPDAYGSCDYAVSFSHWSAVAAQITETAITPLVTSLLDKAHKERMSTRDLSKALKEAMSVPAEGAEPEATEPAKAARQDAKPANPPTPAETAVRLIRQALEILLKTGVYPDFPGRLDLIASEITQRADVLAAEAGAKPDVEPVVTDSTAEPDPVSRAA
jgi:ParB/RepB/Spo0J family partition protein